MDLTTLQSIFTIGETAAVEFKRCGNGIRPDTYETVCSFLNRFGGDLFLGVLDDGTVSGVPEKAASEMIKNFIKVVSNPTLFSPAVYLVPEMIQYDEKHTIIHVHIPPSSEVHSYKKVIYDRVDDADVKVTATGAIAQMYIRKQGIFTEKKIYPYAKQEDLRLDLLPKIRIMAQNHAGGTHPWTTMDDAELLKSAGLYGRDIATGEEGYNLAAIMLLGKDDVILNVAPAYVTDALVRKINIDRYDDREVIKTNLIESYDKLMDFGKKHLMDKFFLEDTVNKSLRNTILREMVSNILMHREFSSSYTAKFVIEKDRMYVENASRATAEGFITVDNLEPNPKNPIIAAFFRNIGYADQLGSGVHNLFKYSKYYSGQEPEFAEGDVFKIIVPLDDSYSFDFGPENKKESQSADKVPIKADKSADKVPIKADKSADKVPISADKGPESADKVPIKADKSADKVPISADKGPESADKVPIKADKSADKVPINADKGPESADKVPINADKGPESADKVPINIDKNMKHELSKQQKQVLQYVKRNQTITSHQAEKLLQVQQRRARTILGEMMRLGLLERQGSYKSTKYVANEKNSKNAT